MFSVLVYLWFSIINLYIYKVSYQKYRISVQLSQTIWVLLDVYNGTKLLYIFEPITALKFQLQCCAVIIYISIVQSYAPKSVQQGEVLGVIDAWVHTLYNAILRIARNFLETRKKIKILTHSFYHINLGWFSWE